MLYRSVIGLVGVLALVLSMGNNVRASEDMKYPNWSGQWGRFAVRGLPGQPSFDQTKGWGPFQQAPLTPEYQKILEESMADQIDGGLGNYSTARCLPGGMPRMMVAFEPQEYIITPHTTYILIGENDHYYIVVSSPTDATGQRTLSRPIRAIRSANGSMKTATASMTCSKSKHAVHSRVRVLTTRPACRCISTISPPSKSGSVSIRTIRAFFMTKSWCSTMP
jgi:hypothetical protein